MLIYSYPNNNGSGCEDDLDQCRLFERFTSLTFILIIITVVFTAFICCLCIKISDWKLRACITVMARRKGVKLDLESLDMTETRKPTPLGTYLHENCTIVIPDVAIVL